VHHVVDLQAAQGCVCVTVGIPFRSVSGRTVGRHNATDGLAPIVFEFRIAQNERYQQRWSGPKRHDTVSTSDADPIWPIRKP
jgi:hypothetical protein